MNFNKQKCITAVILLLVAILSITVIGKYASAPENHQKTIASLDEKKQTVMELTAASTVTSALITLLPGDTATPIAEKMADVSGYLLVVLCAIYLEKYLVTITGYVAFTYLIPIACGLWIFNLIFANATLRKLATKLVVFGLAISFVVPASVKISDLIGDTYQAQIEATIEDARNTQNILENSGVADDDDDTNATETPGIGTTEVPGTVTGNVQEKESNNSGSVSNIFDWAKDAISGAKDSVTNVVENVTVSTEELVQKVENSLNHFIEAVAVMIITSCVIPMLVLLLFFWMVKIVLDVDLSGAKIKGMLPEISDYEQYDNGTKIVGTVTSDIQLIDADNYQMLVDDGYYEEKEIMPEATATPTPTVTSEATVTEEPDIDENTPEAASASSEKEETEISGTPTPEETVTPTPSEKAEKGADA